MRGLTQMKKAINIYLTDEEKKKFKIYCAQNNTTMTDELKSFILHVLESEKETTTN